MEIAAHLRTLFQRRVLPVLFSLCLSIPALASPPIHDEADKEELRRRIKEGELHACVTDSVLSGAPDPVLVFRNHCDVLVNVTLCVRPSGEQKGYYLLLLRPHSEARHRLWMKQERFDYRFNACDRPNCSAPEPEC